MSVSEPYTISKGRGMHNVPNFGNILEPRGSKSFGSNHADANVSNDCC